MKRWKIFFIVGLCAVILSTTVISTYQGASEVKAVAVVDDVALIVIGLLAATGIAVSYSWASNNAEQLVDDFGEAYEEARFTVINGGGGVEPDPDDPDNNDEEPPTFKELVDKCKADGKIDFTKAVGMAAAFKVVSLVAKSDFFASFLGMNTSGVDSSSLDSTISFKNVSGLYNFEIGYSHSYCKNEKLNDYYSSVVGTSSFAGVDPYSSRYDYDKILTFPDGYNSIIYGVQYNQSNFFSDGFAYNPVDNTWANLKCANGRFDIKADFSFLESNFTTHNAYRNVIRPGVDIYINDGNGHIEKFDTDVIWVHPDIEDTYENSGDFELYPPSNPFKIPDINALQHLQDAYDDADSLEDPDATQDAINQALLDYFKNLGLDDDPTVEPDPDKPVDPDNPIDPSPDNPDVPDPDFDKNGLTADLSELFPFCIPFDLIKAIKVFNHEPETPHVEWTLNIKPLNYSYTFVIDLSEFNTVAAICRTMFLLMFIVGLIMATRALIKG